MLDFVKIIVDSKRGIVYPDFAVQKSKDLMIRGNDFYAIWDEKNNKWSKDEDDAIRLIDEAIDEFLDANEYLRARSTVKYLRSSSSGSIDAWHKYVQKQMRDNFTELDSKIVFKSDKVEKTDYVTKRLDYDMVEGSTEAYDAMFKYLFAPEELEKLEWTIGAIISGDSKKIQKFLVLYGDPGTGKSTWIDLVCDMFPDYYAMFESKPLGSANNQFALEPFKKNPLIAIEHDGDLSGIQDNTKINSIVSHEKMIINEKHKNLYSTKFHCFLIMGTNTPVSITGAKSGLNRRLIDVRPTGNKLPIREYNKYKKQLKFELGAIAYHCLKVYEELGPSYYNGYVPRDMKEETDHFYNFMTDDLYEIIKDDDRIQMNDAWARYKKYCEEMMVKFPYSYLKFRSEIRNYFYDKKERLVENGVRYRNMLIGIRPDKFGISEIKLEKEAVKKETPVKESWLIFKEQPSLFDEECKNCLAQVANDKGTPTAKWANVKSTLKDISTKELHYVKVPINHIVVDFDIHDENGEKSLEKNLKAASEWPKTYAELSKSGAGIHLHYIYTGGDPEVLSRVYADNIEIKVFTGNSSLRRKLSLCNDIPIADINSGLPVKEAKKVISFDAALNENAIRTLIKKNLRKEYHPGTKPSVDFIFKVLEDAYNGGAHYDVTDMRPAVLAFAAASTHQSEYCIKLVNTMKFKSEEPSEFVKADNDILVFYDVEVFPNLFLVNWKYRGPEHKVVRMINPTPSEIKDLMRFNLVGFNCRRYDNHILYARSQGYTNEELFRLSQRIVSQEKGKKARDTNCFFGQAYNVSYTDVYDFAAKKQSLKKWEIELGIHHQELGLPWDKPVPKELWPKVAEYCDNDVIATEAVFEKLKGDFLAREILAAVAEMSVNDTTNSLTTRIIFGDNRHPELVYTDLSKEFPGYEFIRKGEDGKPHNMYKGIDVGFGGLVIANPGMYGHTVTLDVASMHPSTIIRLNLFGEYTARFAELLEARIAIKHKDFDKARTLLGGKLAPFLTDADSAKALSQALKIAINSVYGLTSAQFENPFRDIRNVNNIVALRGALFMVNLKEEVEKRGFTVVHIKTDSIKIANPTKEILDFATQFGKKYGYNFEVEHDFEKICLVNDAVYIAKVTTEDEAWLDECAKERKKAEEEGRPYVEPTRWTATGTQFAVSYVFKTLFSHEEIKFEDLCETKSVTGDIYVDMNEGLKDVSYWEDLKKFRTTTGKITKKAEAMLAENADISDEELDAKIAEGHNFNFVGKVGLFCPILPGKGGGELMRYADEKYSSVTGAKGYRWLEAETVKNSGKEADIDISYYRSMVDAAVEAIDKYGDFEQFAA